MKMHWFAALVLTACASADDAATGEKAHAADDVKVERLSLDCAEHFGPIPADEWEDWMPGTIQPISSLPTYTILVPFDFRPDPDDPPQMVVRTRLTDDFIGWVDSKGLELEQAPEVWDPVIRLHEGQVLAGCQFSLNCWNDCAGFLDDGVVDYNEIIGFRMIEPVELVIRPGR